jgi:hypothetical protein
VHSPRQLSRRRFARSAAGLASAAGVASLAGCASETADTGDTFDGPARTLRKWLPAPDALDPESERYRTVQSAFLTSPRSLAAANDRVDGTVFEYLPDQVEGRFRPLDLTAPDVRTMLDLSLDDDVAVAFTDGTTAAHVDHLSDEGYDERDPIRGFRVFDAGGPGDPPGVYALDGGVVVHARGTHAAARVASALATRSGATPRLVDESPAAVALFDHLGGRTLLQATHRDRPLTGDDAHPEHGRFPGTVARGTGGTITGDTFHQRSVTVYDDPADADVDAVREYVDRWRDESRYVGPPEDTTVTRDGRVVVVTTRLPLEDLRRDRD